MMGLIPWKKWGAQAHSSFIEELLEAELDAHWTRSVDGLGWRRNSPIGAVAHSHAIRNVV